MFSGNINPDEIREKLGAIKDKIQLTKDDNGVTLLFLDPDMMNDPATRDFFSPSSFETLRSMIPGGETLEYKVEPVEGGVKFITSDPDAFYELLQKIFDPDFLMNIIEQLMSAFAGPGGLLDSLEDLGNKMEKEAENITRDIEDGDRDKSDE